MSISNIISGINKRLPERFDMTDQNDRDTLENLILTLFDQVFEEAVQLAIPENSAYTVIVSAHNIWSTIADVINKKEIPCKMANGVTQPFVFETYGFILCLLMLPQKDIEIFKPAINDIIDSDIGKAYREYKGQKAKETIPEKQQVELKELNDVSDQNLIAEYFKTFQALGTFNGKRNYKTEEEKELHDRLMILYGRIKENEGM